MDHLAIGVESADELTEREAKLSGRGVTFKPAAAPPYAASPGADASASAESRASVGGIGQGSEQRLSSPGGERRRLGPGVALPVDQLEEQRRR